MAATRLLTRALFLSATLLLSATLPSLSSAQSIDQTPDKPVILGSIEFPNSGSASAQDDFIEGTLFLHSFEYEQAADAYRRAQEEDPGFALAYWGEAMTYNHPVWMQQDRNAALTALNRLAHTPSSRAELARTQREKDLMKSIEVLYGAEPATENLSKEERDDLYANAMRRLHGRYPEDHEIAAFYALSLLGTAHEGREFATYMKAAAVVMPVWESNPEHPGAVHYLIHSFDDPIHAPLGLPMARAYSKIAPAAAHAQHMTSHIFMALGLWDDVVAANIVASGVQNSRNERLGRKENVCGHYTSWLEYGYLETGQFDKARSMLARCFARQSDNPTNSEQGYFSRMRARFVFDTDHWAAAKQFSIESNPNYLFTDAFADLRLGDPKKARAFVGRVRGLDEKDRSDRDKIYMHQLQGLLSERAGDLTAAELHLQAAADHESALPFDFGPPPFVKPTYELLGDFYLANKMPDKAEKAFYEQLQRTANRTSSILGLVRAARESGDVSSADENRLLLEQVWHAADSDVRSALDR